MLALIWWAWHAHGVRQFKAGEAHKQAQWDADVLKSNAEHAAQLKEADSGYQKAKLALQAQLRNALDHPVTRTIRVPVSATCPQPAESGRDAGVHEPDPGNGYVEVVDTGYVEFRSWLLHYGASPEDGR